MAEFDPEEAIEHKGSIVGGISLTEDELDELPLQEIEFADKYNTNYNLLNDFSKGNLLKIELDIDEEEKPDVDERIYEHTYDDVETQLQQLFKYRRRHRRRSANPHHKNIRTEPNEEKCIIGIIKDVKEEKIIFNLCGVNGTITIRPHQIISVYPCFDEQLSVHFGLHEEVLAYII